MADRHFPDIIILFFLSGAVNSKAVTHKLITGGSFTLDPGITGTPTYILWKHGSDKAVEWDAKSESMYREFREFKDKSSLNNITGELTVRGLTKALSGRYNAEFIIQGKLVKFTQEVEVHDPVPQPVVSCVQNSSNTTLHCSATGHPLQYRWSGPGLEGATWSPMYNVTVITAAEPGNYRCEVKNAVSEKRQDFNTKDCGSAGNLPIILGTAFGVLVCISIVVTLLYCFMKSNVKCKGSEDPEQPTHHETNTSICSSIPSSIPPSRVAAALQTPDRNKDGHSPPTGEDESQPLLPELGLSQSNDELEYRKFVKDRVSFIEEAGREGKLVSPRKDKNEGMMKWEIGKKDMTRDSPVGSPPAKPTQALTTEKRSSTDHDVKQADKEKGEEREKTDEVKEERKEKTDKVGDAEEEGMSKQGKEKDNEKGGEQASEGKKEEEEKGQEKDKTESQRVKTSRMNAGIEGNAFLENLEYREKEDEKEEEGRKDDKAEVNVCSSPTKKIPATKQGGMEQDESEPLLQESESNDEPESKGFVRCGTVKHRVKEIDEGKLVSPRKDQNEGMTQQMCQDSPVGSPPAKPPRALTPEKRSSTDYDVKQGERGGEGEN
ncbi:neurofilament heavy polypeptide-like [Centroberyx affinis]|uniref:neurofilament heavy polypeptide-like n=1 Tax=Centroberyx affinis TaxID=166261 RepID=UPI003A5BC5BB